MTVYSIWPYFAMTAVLLAAASAPVFKLADPPPGASERVSSLDGLRGFLALAVFFHHAVINHGFLVNQRWELPPSAFYSLLGQIGVAVFFMITGYLFWSKAVAEKGRPNWLKLYIGRVFRIGPLYVFTISVMLAVVFARTGWRVQVPVPGLLTQICKWLMLGMVQGYDVNGYPGTTTVLAGVTWTLKFEWYFYISLLATSLAARNDRTHLPFACGGMILSLYFSAIQGGPTETASPLICVALFFIGMTCASIEKLGLAPRLSGLLSSSLTALLVVAVFVMFTDATTAAPIALLGAAFCLVAWGSTLFGILTSLAARRLGAISYGIYLLHGLVLTLVFAIPSVRGWALSSAGHYWLIVLVCGFVLVAVAAATHALIEQPGIALGRRIGTVFGRRRPLSVKPELIGS